MEAFHKDGKDCVAYEVSPDIGVAQDLGDVRPMQEDRFYVTDELRGVAPEDADAMLERMIDDVARHTNHMHEGSTITLALITPDLKLHVRHLGDSPVMIFARNRATGETEVTQVTKDHHASDPAERALIEANGGRVTGRQEPGGASIPCINGMVITSRGLGDAKCPGMLRTPDPIAPIDLAAYMKPGYDVWAGTMTDGLLYSRSQWHMGAYLSGMVSGGPDDRLAVHLAQGLVEDCKGRDNLTLALARVREGMPGSVFMMVADGHGGARAADTAMRRIRDIVRHGFGYAADDPVPPTVRDPRGRPGDTQDMPAKTQDMPAKTLDMTADEPAAPPRRARTVTRRMEAFGAASRDAAVTVSPIIDVDGKKKPGKTRPGMGPPRT